MGDGGTGEEDGRGWNAMEDEAPRDLVEREARTSCVGRKNRGIEILLKDLKLNLEDPLFGEDERARQRCGT